MSLLRRHPNHPKIGYNYQKGGPQWQHTREKREVVGQLARSLVRGRGIRILQLAPRLIASPVAAARGHNNTSGARPDQPKRISKWTNGYQQGAQEWSGLLAKNREGEQGPSAELAVQLRYQHQPRDRDAHEQRPQGFQRLLAAPRGHDAAGD